MYIVTILFFKLWIFTCSAVLESNIILLVGGFRTLRPFDRHLGADHMQRMTSLANSARFKSIHTKQNMKNKHL